MVPFKAFHGSILFMNEPKKRGRVKGVRIKPETVQIHRRVTPETKERIDEYLRYCGDPLVFKSDELLCSKLATEFQHYIREDDSTLDSKIIKAEEQNIKELYCICSIDRKAFILIAPVVGESPRDYTIRIKERERYFKGEVPAVRFSGNFVEFRVNKKTLQLSKSSDVIGLKVYASYELALASLLIREKHSILQGIEKDHFAMNVFVKACEHNFVSGLEAGARCLNLDYIFKVEDDRQ